MKHKKYFSPVSYRFFQFVDELFHYLGIGYNTKWGRKFCLWANRDVIPEWKNQYEQKQIEETKEVLETI